MAPKPGHWYRRKLRRSVQDRGARRSADASDRKDLFRRFTNWGRQRSVEPEQPAYVEEVESDLLELIIEGLEQARMTPEQAKPLAKDFLALLPISNPTDMTNKLGRLMREYPHIELVLQRHIERWPLLEQITPVQAAKEAAISEQDFVRASQLRDEEKKLLREMQELTPLHPKKNTRPKSVEIEPMLQRYFARLPILEKIFELRAMSEDAIEKGDFESAARLRDEEKELIRKMRELNTARSDEQFRT
jgi:hypothetical protein